ncbi:polymorphic toxin-type HINT domain-containing protein [Kitasatospora griseola]|uniref:polymorphic toxin-type HINT domain-containing protein n=1 Tax=Kitasatospora griseola TaxID=2064 RepID=UPI00382A046E
MRITSNRWTPWRRGAVGVAVGGLLAGLLATPAFADEAPPIGPVADRVTAMAAWKDGGPAVKRAAETSLAGTDSDVAAFLATGRTVAAEADLRAKVEEIVAASGPEVRAAALKALAGTPTDMRAFTDNGYKAPFVTDQRILTAQIMSIGTPEVREAANKALSGTPADVNDFLTTGQYKARDTDNRIKTAQLMSTGGPEVRAAANAALSGTVDDIREFLRYGYQTAAAHDTETLTISQLADLTDNAAGQAGNQAKAAQDAAAKALASSALAKQAAESAAAETKAAKGEAKKASNAAGKAADAAERAAKAAQTASAAAANANEAARQAAAAAADAARASTLAGSAAALAQSAAAAAASNKDDAAKARDAAVIAKKASADAKTAGEAAAWAIRASSQADAATAAATQATSNADIAALAALDAADQAGVSDEARDRARAAANRAKNAAAEARRASAQVQKIAADAKAAATEAQRASDASSGHAAAAAAAAEQAAAHAGDAAAAATTAQAAATAAQAAADNAANAAAQAHRVADIARASDAERLAAQQAAEVATAQQAYYDEAAKTKQAAWESGKAAELAADTQQLLTEASTPGVDPSMAVTKGRLAATRLLTAGGPWTQIAAQNALEGHDADVLAFLNTDLTLARERDDRTSVTALATASTKPEQRLAAEAASVGTPEQVRAFLATGDYPGKDTDDRIKTAQIMSTGGPIVRESAEKALSGTPADVRIFLATGQHEARNTDNRLLVSQAMTAGGPEVQAAANAALSGPTSGIKPFLTIGLAKARERDAVTAAHVATIASYLQAIDANVAKARQSAALAAQSYATARGAANEAAGYANQAQASATEAATWAAQAAESARQAKASADRAAGYAAQARVSAANAEAAARSADYSAVAAAGSAEQAHKYAADAQKAADDARKSATEAGQSAAKAQQAATQAFLAAYKRVQDAGAAGEMEARTTVVDEYGRIAYVEAVPHDDVKKELLKENSGHCQSGDGSFGIGTLFQDSAWRENAAGKRVCDVTVTIKVTGTVGYNLRFCPVPDLTISECRGKYSTWGVKPLEDQVLKGEESTFTYEMDWDDWHLNKSPKAIGDKLQARLFFGDFIDCFKSPGLNSACAWAASNFIPFGTLGKLAKAGAAAKFAIESGVDLSAAKLAVQATLNGYKSAAIDKLLALADRVDAYRIALKEGIGNSAEDALKILRADPDVSPGLIKQLEEERAFETAIRSCPIAPPGTAPNSFPAGTRVLMGDGTARAIEALRTGDTVTATDPVTGASGPRAVTDILYTPDDRDFTEITVRNNDDTQSAVTATNHHPFWVESTRTWTDAVDLRIGDSLRTNTGATAQVASIRHWTGLEPAYNLTVDDLHSYYVIAGDNPLLVHNATYEEICAEVFPILRDLGRRPMHPQTGERVGPTAGQALVSENGKMVSLKDMGNVVSGDMYGPEVEKISEFLKNVDDPDFPKVPAATKVYPDSEHAEAKIAWRIAEKTKDPNYYEIVINNENGVCMSDDGRFSCLYNVAQILYEGQTARIRWWNKEIGRLDVTDVIKGKRKKS